MRRALDWKRLASRLMAGACLTLFISGLQIPSEAQAQKPSGPEYRLGQEDVITVFVWKEPDLGATVVVRPDGRISLPLVNEIPAAGKTTAELQAEITEKLLQFIAEPVVTVIAKEIHSRKISVLGEVRRPDVYRINDRVTVLDAIAMAGGFTEFAKRNAVIVLRHGPSGQQRFRVDFKQMVERSGQPIYLQPLDTVYVE
jgi:polysaccharide export outer membrane protein